MMPFFGKNLTRQQKVAWSVAVVLLLYLLVGFIGVPFLLRYVLEQKVAEAVNREITVQKVAFNPLSLTARLEELQIAKKDATPLMRAGKVQVNIQAIRSLFRWGLVIQEVLLEDPAVYIARIADNRFNFSDIASAEKAPEKPAEPPAEPAAGPPRFEVVKIQIDNGRLRFDDQQQGVDHRLVDLDLVVRHLSGFPGDIQSLVVANVQGRLNDADLEVEYKGRPFADDRQANVELRLGDLDVLHYLPYVPLPENLVIASSRLDTEVRAEFALNAEQETDLGISGQLSLADVKVQDAQQAPWLDIPELKVDVAPSRILEGELQVASVAIDEPEVNLKRLADGQLYLPAFGTDAPSENAPVEPASDDAKDLTETPQAGPAAPSEAQNDQPFHFRVERLHLAKAKISYQDNATSPVFATTVDPLEITLNGLDNEPQAAPARFELAVTTEADERIEAEGEFHLPSLASEVQLAIHDAVGTKYAPYYQQYLGARFTQGWVDAKTHARYDEDGFGLKETQLVFNDIEMVEGDPEKIILKWPRFALSGAELDIEGQLLDLGAIESAKGYVRVARMAQGDINLACAFGACAKEPASTQTDPASEEDPTSAPATAPPQADTAEPASESKPWRFKASQLRLDDYSVEFEDHGTQPVVQIPLGDVKVHVDGFDTAENAAAKVDVALDWADMGQFATAGQLTVSPFAADLKMDVQKLDLRPIQPYLNTAMHLVITSGQFETQGRFQVVPTEGGASDVRYEGAASLVELKTVDQKEALEFFNSESFRISGLKLGTAPFRLHMDEVALTDFYDRLVVFRSGGTNLNAVFSGAEKETPETAPKAPPKKKPDTPTPEPSAGETPVITIDTVALKGGVIDFSDLLIKPNVKIKMNQMEGRITGLSSVKGKRADLLLSGNVGQSVPVKISGQLNPLIPKPYVNVDFDFGGIDLTPMGPYSGKYMGYRLEKGKLALKLKYLIADDKIDAQNKVLIDQLTLGEAVESEDAINLPFKLALSLLKDRDGNIALDVPVSGDLNDPEFSIGGVVLTVLKNIIVGIVTAPFKVLGAMVGGGEDLQYLAFEPGQSDLPASAREQTGKLAKILYERPGLNLEIRGQADPEKDGAGLRQLRFQRLLKSTKLKALVASGQKAVPLEELQILPEEKALLLERAYIDAQLPMPRDAAGAIKKPAQGEMEKQLIASIAIGENDLRLLAQERAEKVKAMMAADGQVDIKRLFVLDPQLTPQKGKAPAAQVVFGLK